MEKKIYSLKDFELSYEKMLLKELKTFKCTLTSLTTLDAKAIGLHRTQVLEQL